MKRTIIFLALLAIVFLIACPIYVNWYYADLEKKPQKYPYVFYSGSDKPASLLIIDDLDPKREYINYYDKIFRGDNSAVINGFSIQGLPQYDPVYVIKYTDDSILAKVVSLYHHNSIKLGGDYKTGWVYARALHDKPPPKQQ